MTKSFPTNSALVWFDILEMSMKLLMQLEISHTCIMVRESTIFVKLQLFSYPSVLSFVLGDQKNRLNETVLLSIHNICFC